MARRSGPSRVSSFKLDPRLAADSHFIADGPLSQLRLMDDSRFAWLVLVPRVVDACELIDLEDDAQRLLMAEIKHAGNLLRACSPCDKLNIGALSPGFETNDLGFQTR